MNEPETFLDELQHHVDHVHAGVDRASLPPPGLWRSIRLQAKTESENEEMHNMNGSAAFAPIPIAPTDAMPPLREGFRHHLGLAATFALVLTVALGGWFASMQLNQPGNSNGQLAMVSQSDGDGTCDVEPMTVDEVLAIVENPYSAVETSWWATPAPGDEPAEFEPAYRQEYVVFTDLYVMFPPRPDVADYSVPEEQTFLDANATAERFLNCRQNGTYGQIWALTEPSMIQTQVLWNFPLYRDAETLRAYIQDRVDEPYGSLESNAPVPSEFTLSTNPRRGDARIWVTDSPEWFDYDKAMYIGIQATDIDGEVIYTDDWNATTVDGDANRSNGNSLILVHSESTGKWYFINFHAPRG